MEWADIRVGLLFSGKTDFIIALHQTDFIDLLSFFLSSGFFGYLDQLIPSFRATLRTAVWSTSHRVGIVVFYPGPMNHRVFEFLQLTFPAGQLAYLLLKPM